MARINTGANARETVYRTIRGRIINLELKPNDVLNEKELADEIGISRTPVHEAILRLSLEHLVVVRPQSGTIVAPIDLKNVNIEQFNRCVMEKEISRMACALVEEAHRQRYEENVQLYRFYSTSQNPNRNSSMFKLDNAFHRISFEIVDKAESFDWMMKYFQHIERIRLLSLHLDIATHIIEDHEQYIEILFRRDERRICELLDMHLKRYMDDLLTIRKIYPDYFRE